MMQILKQGLSTRSLFEEYRDYYREEGTRGVKEKIAHSGWVGKRVSTLCNSSSILLEDSENRFRRSASGEPQVTPSWEGSWERGALGEGEGG